MDNLTGQLWGNYYLVQRIGSGGFAQVYLGKHVRLGMQAAIKILQTHLAGSEIGSFQQEAQIIANLKHTHIIRVLDFDLHNGTPFLVLDYASQGSLRQKHPGGIKLPLPLISSYVTQIASALAYAHDCKLIHRDVKPENLLLGDHGQVLLSDFGIATIAHATSSLPTQASVGTLAYVAPEQIQGKPRAASDQYALAVVVYQWLCGTLPFQGSSSEIIAQHLVTPPPSPRNYAPECPPEIEQVILKALAKEPKERFDSIETFACSFEQACKPVSSIKNVFLSTGVMKAAANPAPKRASVEKPGSSTLTTQRPQEHASALPKPTSLLRNGLLYGRWFAALQVTITIIAALLCTLWPFPPDLLSHLSPLEILLFKTQYMIDAMIMGTSKWFFVPDLRNAAITWPAFVILTSRVGSLVISFAVGISAVRRTGKVVNGFVISLWAHLWSLLTSLLLLLLLVVLYEWLWSTAEPNIADVSPGDWISWLPAWTSTTFLFLCLDVGLSVIGSLLGKKRR